MLGIKKAIKNALVTHHDKQAHKKRIKNNHKQIKLILRRPKVNRAV